MKQDPKTLPAMLVIKKFGGLRPLAKRINVAPSTVQGWKERGVVPSHKVPLVLNAAMEDGIELFEAPKPPSGETTMEKTEPGIQSRFSQPQTDSDRRDHSDRREGQDRRRQQDPSFKGPDRRINDRRSGLDRRQQRAAEWVHKKKFLERWLVTVTFLFVVFLCLASFLLMPEYMAMKQRTQGYVELENKVKSLNTKIHDLSKQQGSLSGKINKQIERIDQTKQEVIDKVSSVEKTAAEMAAGGWQQKYSVLEQKLFGMTTMMDRMDSLMKTPQGAEALNNSLSLLRTHLSQSDGQDAETIDNLRQRDPILGTLMKDVDGTDVKAAAVLLGLNQLRAAQGSDAAPYQEDLELIKKLAGDDPKTLEAINQLAPYAQSGVLSQQSLETEFKGLAGDIVMAKLRGEDASVQDMAMSRLSKLVKVRKIDELEGQSTDAVVARAQLMLEQGNVQGAIAELETLDGESAAVAQPWIQKAQARVQTDQATSSLSDHLIGRIVGSQSMSPTAVKGLIKSLMGSSGVSSDVVSGGGQQAPMGGFGGQQGAYPGLAK